MMIGRVPRSGVSRDSKDRSFASACVTLAISAEGLVDDLETARQGAIELGDEKVPASVDAEPQELHPFPIAEVEMELSDRRSALELRFRDLTLQVIQ